MARWQHLLLLLCLVCAVGWTMLNAVQLQAGVAVLLQVALKSSDSESGLLTPGSESLMGTPGLESRRPGSGVQYAADAGTGEGDPECGVGESTLSCEPTDIVVHAEVRSAALLMGRVG